MLHGVQQPGQQQPGHRMLRRVIRRNKRTGREEVVSEEHVGADESRGLRLRRREYEDLQEAAEAGSTQAKLRLSGARKALRRQEEHARRLKRVG